MPALAEWSIVSVVDDDMVGSPWECLRDAASWHDDPALRPVAQRYTELRMGSLDESSFLARALIDGKAVVLAEKATEAIMAVLAPGEARDLLRELRPESALILPLRAHGRTPGLLMLCRGPGYGPFSPTDVATAHEVASRAGLALDNARLYGQQRALAEGLQRALLTEPPQPDHGQIAVRYTPAKELSQVGGDWYDAFLQPEGATMLVIGDVVGHDIAAAAAMGQIRSLLRGIAVTSGQGPADVLSRLDTAMELLRVDTTATAVVARLEQTPEERREGLTRLRWSNAGHPPPVAITADHQVMTLGGSGGDDADLLLGVDPQTQRREYEVTLKRGATILLYTDGLIERRRQSLDDGLARLFGVLAESADLPLEELCDQVLDHMLPDTSSDDVALVAIRMHRQEGPRPPQAGPERLPPGVD